MFLGDKYYGRAVTEYEAARNRSRRWELEQEAVDAFVELGPVLDVPIGTGRYCEGYKRKGLEVHGLDISDDMLNATRSQYPWVLLQQGNALELPWPAKTFGTVVCTRLLDWLDPHQMRKAVSELCRVADNVVLTIRHGKQECRTNWTHELSSFYDAINGWHIAERRTTEETRDGIEEVMLLRKPRWSDVLAQLDWPDKERSHAADDLQRLGTEWMPKLPRLGPDTASVLAEYWPGTELGRVIEVMAKWNRSYRTDESPRFETKSPVTLLHWRKRCVVIDGRRRINAWSKSPDLYPVLRVKVL